MRDADKDRDPVKARKRATSDLRCAVRKLGTRQALAEIDSMIGAGDIDNPPDVRIAWDHSKGMMLRKLGGERS